MDVSVGTCAELRESVQQYFHCIVGNDSAQHTLEEYAAWAEEREALRRIVGEDLSQRAVLIVIVGGNEKWRAFSFFCKTVIPRKKEPERVRRRELTPIQNEMMAPGGIIDVRRRRVNRRVLGPVPPPGP